MRKFLIFLCTFVMIIFFVGCKKNYTHGVYEVIIDADCIYNETVGNEWRKVYKCGSQTIKSGEQWTIPLGSTKEMKIDATITEVDAWSDVGNGYMYVSLKDGFKTSTEITVKENKGRYRGNEALWKVTCEVKLTKKLESN